jgi:arylsulfatase A-like enzyme
MAQSRWFRLALFSTLVAVCVAEIGSSRSRPQTVDRPGLGSLPAGVTRSDLNILLITLDTTRADRLGAYGFQSISTPNIDRLAREGVLFEQTAAAAPLTLPAHASLFTGRFPFGHGVRDNAGFVLDPRETTFAEILQQRGYETGAFVGSYVLASGRGLSQGFDIYRDDFNPPDRRDIAGGVRRRADEVVDRALSWLVDVGSSRFFAWLHFYDAHAPYDPPEPDRTLYAGRPYDGEIAFMDSQAGRILAFLRQRGFLDRTIVVVIGDHGESLGDHGEATHGVFVYESVIRVPFIIRTPFERLRGRIVDDLTRSIDMMPTLLDLLGIRSPAAADGTSLVPLMTGAVRSLDLEAYSESLYPLHQFGWSDLHALRAGRFKAIAAPRPELYDLQQDPFEEHNVYETRRALGERMIARLRRMEARPSASTSPDRSRIDVDAELAARLGALGYVARSGGSHPTGDASGLPDPKDQIGTIGPGGRP